MLNLREREEEDLVLDRLLFSSRDSHTHGDN